MYGDPWGEFDPSHLLACQGYSMSMEPTQIDRLPMTSYYPRAYIHIVPFPRKRRFRSKTANFSHPGVFSAPLRDFHMKFVTVVAPKKNYDGGKTLTISALLRIQYYNVSERRKDRRTELLNQYRALYTTRADV